MYTAYVSCSCSLMILLRPHDVYVVRLLFFTSVPAGNLLPLQIFSFKMKQSPCDKKYSSIILHTKPLWVFTKGQSYTLRMHKMYWCSALRQTR